MAERPAVNRQVPGSSPGGGARTPTFEPRASCTRRRFFSYLGSGSDQHHAGIRTFAQDPSRATYDYFADVTPGQLALDGLDLALTAIPVGVGATAGRGARQATREFIDDPAAFRSQRRAMMDDTGTAEVPSGSRVTMDTCDGRAYQGVEHIRDKFAREVSSGNPSGSHSWAKSMTDDELATTFMLMSHVTNDGFWMMVREPVTTKKEASLSSAVATGRQLHTAWR